MGQVGAGAGTGASALTITLYEDFFCLCEEYFDKRIDTKQVNGRMSDAGYSCTQKSSNSAAGIFETEALLGRKKGELVLCNGSLENVHKNLGDVTKIENIRSAVLDCFFRSNCYEVNFKPRVTSAKKGMRQALLDFFHAEHGASCLLKALQDAPEGGLFRIVIEIPRGCFDKANRADKDNASDLNSCVDVCFGGESLLSKTKRKRNERSDGLERSTKPGGQSTMGGTPAPKAFVDAAAAVQEFAANLYASMAYPSGFDAQLAYVAYYHAYCLVNDYVTPYAALASLLAAAATDVSGAALALAGSAAANALVSLSAANNLASLRAATTVTATAAPVANGDVSAAANILFCLSAPATTHVVATAVPVTGVPTTAVLATAVPATGVPAADPKSGGRGDGTKTPLCMQGSTRSDGSPSKAPSVVTRGSPEKLFRVEHKITGSRSNAFDGVEEEGSPRKRLRLDS